MPQRPAIILLSGGLDSSTVLAEATRSGRRCHALSFRYGQRHDHTRSRRHQPSRVISRFASTPCWTSIWRRSVGPRSPMRSAFPRMPLTKTGESRSPTCPRATRSSSRSRSPTRRFAKAREIWLGVNAIDYSGYPDCRPEYIAAFEAMANLATREGVEGRGDVDRHAAFTARQDRHRRTGPSSSASHSSTPIRATTPLRPWCLLRAL